MKTIKMGSVAFLFGTVNELQSLIFHKIIDASENYSGKTLNTGRGIINGIVGRAKNGIEIQN